jgi:hypothetical protein
VASYRPYLSDEDVAQIKILMKKQFHYLITPEIRKALSPQHHGEFDEKLMEVE